jgi:Mn-dependent DtxR family transcriptional regulator
VTKLKHLTDDQIEQSIQDFVEDPERNFQTQHFSNWECWMREKAQFLKKLHTLSKSLLVKYLYSHKRKSIPYRFRGKYYQQLMVTSKQQLIEEIDQFLRKFAQSPEYKKIWTQIFRI